MPECLFLLRQRVHFRVICSFFVITNNIYLYIIYSSSYTNNNRKQDCGGDSGDWTVFGDENRERLPDTEVKPWLRSSEE